MVDPLGPLSQLARRASPHYTVTYLLTVVFGFAAACIIAGVFTGGLIQVALIVCGMLLGTASFGLAAYLILGRPELLRSEPHLRFLAIMAWSRDPSLDEDAVRRRERVLPALLTGEVRKFQANRSVAKESDSDD